MSDVIEVRLPWPDKALHSNARVHWAQKSKATASARQYARTMAKKAGVGILLGPAPVILIEYWPPTRRGDPQNVPAALKAHIDGIADAMGCDDKKFEVDYPRCFAGTKPGGEVVYRIFGKGE